MKSLNLLVQQGHFATANEAETCAIEQGVQQWEIVEDILYLSLVGRINIANELLGILPMWLGSAQGIMLKLQSLNVVSSFLEDPQLNLDAVSLRDALKKSIENQGIFRDEEDRYEIFLQRQIRELEELMQSGDSTKAMNILGGYQAAYENGSGYAGNLLTRLQGLGLIDSITDVKLNIEPVIEEFE